jgi:hypothetical protein
MIEMVAADVGAYSLPPRDIKEIHRAVFEADCAMIDNDEDGAYLHILLIALACESYHLEMSFFPHSIPSPDHHLYK